MGRRPVGYKHVHEKTSEETDFSLCKRPKISVRITPALSKPTQTIFNHLITQDDTSSRKRILSKNNKHSQNFKFENMAGVIFFLQRVTVQAVLINKGLTMMHI